LITQGRMRPPDVVGANPRAERLRAARRARVGTRVRPFADQGLDKAFGLAIGLGPVGPGAFQTELMAGCDRWSDGVATYRAPLHAITAAKSWWPIGSIMDDIPPQSHRRCPRMRLLHRGHGHFSTTLMCSSSSRSAHAGSCTGISPTIPRRNGRSSSSGTVCLWRARIASSSMIAMASSRQPWTRPFDRCPYRC